MVVMLDEDEVMTIRRRLASTGLAALDFGAVEPLHANNLGSAVGRQSTGFGGKSKYQSFERVAATLFYGLVLNHAFENGNKRTALVVLLVLIDRNRLLLVDTTEDDLYDLATSVADHRIHASGERALPDDEVGTIAAWLKPRLRPLRIGDRTMDFKEFKATLIDQGCTFDKPHQNFVKIRRQTPDREFTYRLGYPRPHFEVRVNTVKVARRRLGLDYASGIDSDAFYYLEAVVDGFVAKYSQVLIRLSET